VASATGGYIVVCIYTNTQKCFFEGVTNCRMYTENPLTQPYFWV